MSKNILVKRCYECPYRKFNSVTGKGTCTRLQEIIYKPLEFLPQCPLQDTTELLKALEDITFNGMGKGLIKDIKNGEYDSGLYDDYNLIHKALGGQDEG